MINKSARGEANQTNNNKKTWWLRYDKVKYSIYIYIDQMNTKIARYILFVC